MSKIGEPLCWNITAEHIIQVGNIKNSLSALSFLFLISFLPFISLSVLTPSTYTPPTISSSPTLSHRLSPPPFSHCNTDTPTTGPTARIRVQRAQTHLLGFPARQDVAERDEPHVLL